MVGGGGLRELRSHTQVFALTNPSSRDAPGCECLAFALQRKPLVVLNARTSACVCVHKARDVRNERETRRSSGQVCPEHPSER